MKVHKLTQLFEEKKLTKKQILDLFKKAEDGDTSLLKRKDLDTLKDEDGDTLLHVLALNGADVLHHPSVATVTNNQGKTPLHIMVDFGNKDVLKHPEAIKARDDIGDTPLHYLANIIPEDDEILNHPEVSTIRNDNGRTPLHAIALSGRNYLKTLAHNDIAKVQDENGDTPLHDLARNRDIDEILDHPHINRVKNKQGETPLDIYAGVKGRSSEDLMKWWEEKKFKSTKFKPLTKKIELD